MHPETSCFLQFLVAFSPLVLAAAVPIDVAGVRPGPIVVEAKRSTLEVTWLDESSRVWKAVFSLDPSRPLIESISIGKAHRRKRPAVLLLLHRQTRRRLGQFCRNHHGLSWVPPFKPVLKAMRLNAVILTDFHGDGHTREISGVRLEELKAYDEACRRQSDREFRLIASEEANIYLGDHWGLNFPKPVYWFMKRSPGTNFQSIEPGYGTVYRVGDAAELAEMVRREDGVMFQTHPRTKSSRAYSDKNFDAPYFRDQRHLGASWKAMNADLSSPGLGDRAFKLLDDMSNRGIRKRVLGEIDIFQIDGTHELWGHMNTNYVRMQHLPAFDDYGTVLKAFANGDYFVSTGEVQLPRK